MLFKAMLVPNMTRKCAVKIQVADIFMKMRRRRNLTTEYLIRFGFTSNRNSGAY